LSRLFFDEANAAGLNTGTSEGLAIIPVILGNSVLAVALSQKLFERGINVQPIIHPAVPERAARLRFFLTSEHNEDQIRGAVSAIAESMRELGQSRFILDIAGLAKDAPA
jgi:7-keto-8-aminopelargonate synthetase-like enzyme